MPDPGDVVLNASQAARYLGLYRTTIDYAIQRGRLKAEKQPGERKIGDRYRIKVCDLLEYNAQREARPGCISGSRKIAGDTEHNASVLNSDDIGQNKQSMR